MPLQSAILAELMGRRDLLRAAVVVVQPIQPEAFHVAPKAFVTAREEGFGRGSTLATVSIYAQAKAAGASLLKKGEDFSKKDIESAA